MPFVIEEEISILTTVSVHLVREEECNYASEFLFTGIEKANREIA